MEEGSPIVIAMLGSAVAGLFGVLVWLVKMVINHQDQRIATLELRETAALDTVAKNVETVATGMNVVTEALREIRLLLYQTREERNR